MDEAVRLLASLVTQPEQARVSVISEEELIPLDFGLGTWIRNNLGLWQENQALRSATKCQSDDDASAEIVYAFWLALRAEQPKIHLQVAFSCPADKRKVVAG